MSKTHDDATGVELTEEQLATAQGGLSIYYPGFDPAPPGVTFTLPKRDPIADAANAIADAVAEGANPIVTLPGHTNTY
jgi:hypothetical protein